MSATRPHLGSWLASLALSLTLGCDYDDKALNALDAHGFSHVHLASHSWGMGCGRDDSYGRYFTAKNPLGKPVSGVVCCGVRKGCTIRF